jgi:hypothetical protein
VAEQSFDFGVVGFGMLAANSFTGDFTGYFVQVKCKGQPLLSRHPPIVFDLFV